MVVAAARRVERPHSLLGCRNSIILSSRSCPDQGNDTMTCARSFSLSCRIPQRDASRRFSLSCRFSGTLKRFPSSTFSR